MTAPTPPTCRDMILLTQAELDGELDAAAAVAAAAHRADCPECRAAYQIIAAAKSAVHDRAVFHKMPDEARRALLNRLQHAGIAGEKRRMAIPWRAGGLFAAAGALAAALLLLLTVPREPEFGAAVVDAHIRALQPGHLLDKPSTNQHDVMPWYVGKIDFAPPVKNLADQGFPLQGGRLDYVGGHEAAALVYYYQQHPIDLIVWRAPGAAETEPVFETRNGYNILHWQQQEMSFWAVSDVEASRLRDFVQKWRSKP